MSNQPLEIKVSIQVSKLVSEVFDAIVDPDKMSRYFIAKSTGRMEERKTLTWYFPEFEEGFPVRIGRIEQDKYVSFTWDSEDGKPLQVEMTLSPQSDGEATKITITEKGQQNDEAGIQWLKGNTEGWANFLACLKAYLEYGINLRKGAFDYLKG